MTFATLSASQIKPTLTALNTVSPGLMKEWRRRAKREVAEPWAAILAAQAPAGTLGAAAGRSVKAGSGTLPVIWAGKGAWNGWQPFFGLEFGGQKDAKVTYVGRSPAGNKYVMRRRTTMQFQPHLGRVGYWLFPYWRGHEPVLRAKVIRLADDFIEEHLG